MLRMHFDNNNNNNNNNNNDKIDRNRGIEGERIRGLLMV